jgi:O-methyltransferase involved in polyketide biosynthesis
MTVKEAPNLQGVAETLLIPLDVIARESRRPDAILKDETAAQLIQRIDYDFSGIQLRQHDQVLLCIRHREFDRLVSQFLARHPRAVVVHIGCGLDTRFDRVDNGQVEWYDLDLPEVIGLRARLLPVSSPRCHSLSSSVFETGWLDQVSSHLPLPVMFISEGVFLYFEPEQVRELVLRLRARFPGSALVLDAATPLMVKLDNLHLVVTKIKARTHWGLKNPRDLESWDSGIKLLDSYYYFDRPEPRLKAMAWMRPITPLSRGAGIFHYRLG